MISNEFISNLSKISLNTLSASLKTINLEVLKSLGDNIYLVKIENKTLKLESKNTLPLDTNLKALVDTKDKNLFKVLSFAKIPLFLQNIQNKNSYFDLTRVLEILKNSQPHKELKTEILELLSKTTSKDDFTTLSSTLLSLNAQTLSIPFEYMGFMSLLQMKKRYNKNLKRYSLDFFGFFEHLLSIKGVITEYEDNIKIELSVLNSYVKEVLLKEVSSLRYNITINIDQNIEPLYDMSLTSLLDKKV